MPDYFGNYFNGQIRQVEQAALANAMEKKYGTQIDRPGVYVETIVRSLEGSLQRLKTDHVDLMMCPHGAASAAEVQIPEIYEAFEKLRKQGKVRFLGVSAHNDPAGVLKAAMQTGVYSLAMVACNILNWPYVAPVVEEAYNRDFGVIAMKTAQVIFEPDRSTTPIPERAALLETDDSRRAGPAPESLPLRAQQSSPFRRDFEYGGRKAGQGESAGGASLGALASRLDGVPGLAADRSAAAISQGTSPVPDRTSPCSPWRRNICVCPLCWLVAAAFSESIVILHTGSTTFMTSPRGKAGRDSSLRSE